MSLRSTRLLVRDSTICQDEKPTRRRSFGLQLIERAVLDGPEDRITRYSVLLVLIESSSNKILGVPCKSHEYRI